MLETTTNPHENPLTKTSLTNSMAHPSLIRRRRRRHSSSTQCVEGSS